MGTDDKICSVYKQRREKSRFFIEIHLEAELEVVNHKYLHIDSFGFCQSTTESLLVSEGRTY